MLYRCKSTDHCYSVVFNQPPWSKKLFIIILKMTLNNIIQCAYHNYVDYTGICPRSVNISWSGHFDRSCFCQSIAEIWWWKVNRQLCKLAVMIAPSFYYCVFSSGIFSNTSQRYVIRFFCFISLITI